MGGEADAASVGRVEDLTTSTLIRRVKLKRMEVVGRTASLGKRQGDEYDSCVAGSARMRLGQRLFL